MNDFKVVSWPCIFIFVFISDNRSFMNGLNRDQAKSFHVKPV